MKKRLGWIIPSLLVLSMIIWQTYRYLEYKKNKKAVATFEPALSAAGSPKYADWIFTAENKQLLKKELHDRNQRLSAGVYKIQLPKAIHLHKFGAVGYDTTEDGKPLIEYLYNGQWRSFDGTRDVSLENPEHYIRVTQDTEVKLIFKYEKNMKGYVEQTYRVSSNIKIRDIFIKQ